MKPLLKNELKSFLTRFENFIGSEVRSITIKSPTVMEVRLSVQDVGRAFDWIDIGLEFINVSDARLVDDSKLSFLDMQEGMSLFFEDNEFILAHGEYSSKENAKDSAFYIVSQAIKFEELPFSE